MFRMWGLARVVVLSAGAVTRTPSTDASTSSACAVFDKSASSAWGGVHETEYQKDNETPESITVDGNTYTIRALDRSEYLEKKKVAKIVPYTV